MKKKQHKKKKEMHPGHYEDASPMTGEDRPHLGERQNKPKMFIAGAIKHPGALRKELHVKKGKKIPEKKLEKAAHAKGKEGKRARLAITLRKLSHHKKRK